MNSDLNLLARTAQQLTFQSRCFICSAKAFIFWRMATMYRWCRSAGTPIAGDLVIALETRLGDLLGAGSAKVITAASGTAAIEAAVLATAARHGRPPLRCSPRITFVATAAAIECSGYVRTESQSKRRGTIARGRRDQLDTLIAQATVDCYNDSEMATGLLLAIQENVALPFCAQIFGLTVDVSGIDVNEAGEIFALCKPGGKRQRISLVDVVLPVPPPEGAE